MYKIGRFLRAYGKWVFAGVFMAVALVPSLYFYNKYQRVEKNVVEQDRTPQSDVKSLEEQVGKHMTLPKETPSIARVSDADTLREKEFFKDAEVGDKVLFYPHAKLGVLYRPSTDKIINAAPIVDPGPTANPRAAVGAPASPAAAPVTVVVYNGTEIAGFAREIGEKVKSAYSGATLGEAGNAADQTHTSTVVVDVSGHSKEAADAIAKALNGTVSGLPSGEKKPNADILIIAGKEQQP